MEKGRGPEAETFAKYSVKGFRRGGGTSQKG